MEFLTFCATTLFILAGASSLDFLSEWSQGLCESFANEGLYGPWKAALICGIKLGATEVSYEMRAFGLLHLIVVSGAHLIFLENLLLKPLFYFAPARIRRAGSSVCIVGYCFLAGLQEPLVRALFQRSSWRFQSQSIFVSGLLTALFFREVTLSLLLSWSCALLISWPTLKSAHPLTRSLVILVGLYPLLLPMGAPSATSAFLQPFFSLVFGVVIFPFSILGLILPLSGLVDLLWETFFGLIKWAGGLGLPLRVMKLPWLSRELYLLSLQALYWRAEISVSREKIWGSDQG